MSKLILQPKEKNTILFRIHFNCAVGGKKVQEEAKIQFSLVY